MSRRAVFAIAAAGFAAFVGLYATQPLLPLFEAVFGLSKAQAGLTVSASTLAVAAMAPVVGAWADRVARKRAIVAGGCLLCVCVLACAGASGYRALLLWRFLQGLAVPVMYVPALAYVSEEAGEAGVGRAMASYVTGNVLGGFTGRTVSGLVAEAFDWRASFVALAALTLAATAVTWQLLPESRRFAPQRRTTSWRGLRGAFTRQLAVTLLIGFNVLFVQVAAFSYIVFHLSAPPFSLGTGVLSGIFVTYLAGAGVTPIAGPFIDRLGSRRVLMRALGGGMVGALVTLAPSVPAIVLGLAICASCTFICQSASTAYLRVAAAPEVRALASGLYVTAYYTGGSVGGVVPGFLWSAARWPGCVALMLSVQAMTLLLAHRFWRGPASLLHQRGIGG